MTLIQIFNTSFKKYLSPSFLSKGYKFKISNVNLMLFSSLIAIIALIFFSTSNIISKKNKKNEDNFKTITKSNEFSNLTSYIYSKIKSPYKETKYTIQNNDSIEKILIRYGIKSEDIKNENYKNLLELSKKKLIIKDRIKPQYNN